MLAGLVMVGIMSIPGLMLIYMCLEWYLEHRRIARSLAEAEADERRRALHRRSYHICERTGFPNPYA